MLPPAGSMIEYRFRWTETLMTLGALVANEAQDADWSHGRTLDVAITPAEFEAFVADLFEAAMGDPIEDLRVAVQESIQGVDGQYKIDATVRFRLGGMDFLVLVEAKKHTGSIERQVVQVLKDKMHSVGAQKGVVIATAPFQSGAIDYAEMHGIALVTVSEGRFTFESRGAGTDSELTREEARVLGSPDFVGHVHRANGERVLVSSEIPDYIPELLLGIEGITGVEGDG
ncbi:restriction endonuclease [Nocardia sp. NPDC058633]|uniref:restriction endonuclease n=1 Tax=Nocardia sp. NPDC058633 TaxID=3346568 RepID=UPI003658DC96